VHNYHCRNSTQDETCLIFNLTAPILKIAATNVLLTFGKYQIDISPINSRSNGTTYGSGIFIYIVTDKHFKLLEILV